MDERQTAIVRSALALGLLAGSIVACGGGSDTDTSASTAGQGGEQGGSKAIGGGGQGASGGSGGANPGGGGSTEAGGAGGTGGGGGSGGSGAEDGYKSGTRLKLEWLDYGGSRVVRALYDKTLAEQCYVETWSDGDQYCTPIADSLAYSDASCTAKIGVAPHPATCATPPPNYFTEYQYASCGVSSVAHVYKRGAAVAEPSYYVKSTNGTCSGPYAGAGNDFFALGNEVTTADLVKVTESAPEGTGRFQEVYLRSVDGLQIPWAVEDTTLQTQCYFQEALDGASAKCTPLNLGYASFYHDASCTTAEVAVGAGCAVPEFAVEYTQPNCADPKPNTWKLGAASGSTPLYLRNSGGICTATSGSSAIGYYAGTATVLLPDVPRAPDTIAGRDIEPIHLHPSGGATFLDYTLYDTRHHAECFSQSLPDGSIICNPSQADIETYYSTATCTAASAVDVMRVYTGAAGCAPIPLPAYGEKVLPVAVGQCSASIEIHPAGTAIATALYRKSGVTCLPVTDTTYSSYTVGAAIPLSDFSLATLVTDP